MWFTSDNGGPAAPEIVAALAAANAGTAASYGAEPGMARATARLRALFEAPEAAVYLVATGTAANALALATLCPPWGAVLCHRKAHVETDECGAPEFFTGGAKLVLLDGDHGRIDPASLQAALARSALASVHQVQRGALTLTNGTEAGTVYHPDALARLAGLARAAGIPVHLDGARFANALASLGCSPAELSWKAGIDALSLGATKNGCLGVEVVILFDPAHAREFELRRKRAGHLVSKHRYLSAQIEAWLADGLWLALAARANARAAHLAAGLRALGLAPDHPVEANIVFATWPRRLHRAALEAGADYYLWNAAPDGPESELVQARLVCNWATTDAEIDRLLALLGSPGFTCQKRLEARND